MTDSFSLCLRGDDRQRWLAWKRFILADKLTHWTLFPLSYHLSRETSKKHIVHNQSSYHVTGIGSVHLCSDHETDGWGGDHFCEAIMMLCWRYFSFNDQKTSALDFGCQWIVQAFLIPRLSPCISVDFHTQFQLFNGLPMGTKKKNHRIDLICCLWF